MWSIQSSIFYLLWPTFFKNRGTGFCARFYCSECPKSPYFSMVLRDSKYQVLLRYARMCNRFEIKVFIQKNAYFFWRCSKYQVLLRYARMCNRFEITRNRLTGDEPVRGFESHALRQRSYQLRLVASFLHPEMEIAFHCTRRCEF